MTAVSLSLRSRSGDPPATAPASIHDFAAVDRLARACKVDPQQLRALRNGYYKKRLDPAALADRFGGADAWFRDRLSFDTLRLVHRDDSRRDGATKLVFRTADERHLESVILRMASGRTSLCVSSQVGCAAACRFCATGQMGLVRNLSAAEIVDQLLLANRLLAGEKRVVRNLVFMGMGEPLHNEPRLHQAIDLLIDPRAFHLHPRRIVVSTVGMPAAMVRLASRYPQTRMAVSLHSARPEVRSRLVPTAERHSLLSLREAIERVTQIQRHAVMIEYLLLDEVNDQPRDAAALVEFLHGLDVHVNLIPYNPIEARPGEASTEFAASPPERREAFARTVKAAGFPLTTRYSLGADISAACGQLARRQDRAVTRIAAQGSA